MSVERSSPRGAVFLSYAREDSPAAQRIAEALRAFGVEVWFDQSELRGGDSWDQKIRTQIKTCALFLPLISQRTEERAEGYFRREWKLAVDRTQDMVGSKAFIVPVVIDETQESAAAVPEEFMRYQWTRLANAEPSPEFVAQVKRLLEAPKKSPAAALEAGRSRPARSEEAVASPTASPAVRRALRARLGWAAAIAALVLVGIFGWRLMQRNSDGPTASEAAARRSAPPTTEKASAKADDKSVAVLAFADLSEAHNSEYFSDGISEELLNVLAKVPGLRVAARTSAFFFKGKNLPIPEIAAKLNVAYVVEGSVQRAGERVKITAQLIKATDGFHLWSDTFTRDAKDVFAVQEEIAGRIAKELSLKLGVSSAASTAAVNPQALELYLQARQGLILRTPQGYAQAEEALNRALTLEPNFARAYALRAMTWSIRDSTAGLISAFGQRSSPMFARIQAQIDRALALEPNLAEAHTAQGNVDWFRWQQDDAARELRKAIALNPSDATAHQVLGRVLMSNGRMDEAQAALKQAAELDPLSHRILDNYAIVMRLASRFDEALALDDRAVALQPNALQANVWKTLDLSGLGRHDEAVALLRRLPVDDTVYVAYGLSVFVNAGLSAEAEQHLSHVPAEARYIALAQLGRHDAALAALDPATLSIQSLQDLFLSQAYNPIRNDPRFVKLLATLGMTEAHARAQAWRATLPPSKSK